MREKKIREKKMRIVIKAGTDLLVKTKGKLNKKVIEALAEQLIRLSKMDHEIIFVTSGAVAYGWKPDQGDDILSKSRASMRGQPKLISYYGRLFGKFGLEIAQALYTYTDLKENAEFIATNLIRGFRDKELTIVNFDDACADNELITMGAFGDNDILSAMIANLIMADLLIILSNVAGLWTGPPEKTGSKFISEIKQVTPEVLAMAQTDGMRMKLRAAQLVQKAGRGCIITDGSEKDILLQIIEEKKKVGTYFVPEE